MKVGLIEALSAFIMWKIKIMNKVWTNSPAHRPDPLYNTDTMIGHSGHDFALGGVLQITHHNKLFCL